MRLHRTHKPSSGSTCESCVKATALVDGGWLRATDGGTLYPLASAQRLDGFFKPLLGCWAGITATEAGSTAICGRERLVIGSFCPHCDPGRLALSDSTVLCNHCHRSWGVVDELHHIPMANALEYIERQHLLAEQYRLMLLNLEAILSTRRDQPRPHDPIRWAIGLHQGRMQARAVWLGQPCPCCRLGGIAEFAEPDGSETKLACGNT